MQVHRLLEGIATEDWYPPTPSLAFVGFEDVSDQLDSGVYILERRGKVVYVGVCTSFIERIAKHRELLGRAQSIPLPIPGVRFDRVHFRRCALDLAETLAADLISRYSPRHNTRTSPHACSAAS